MIRFMSKAAASFVMLDANAKEVLSAAGSDWSEQGIWRVEKLDEIIQRLQQAHDQSAALAKHQDQVHALADRDDERVEAAQPASVGFYRRLYPVLDMLRAAKAADEPVVWEQES